MLPINFTVIFPKEILDIILDFLIGFEDYKSPMNDLLNDFQLFYRQRYSRNIRMKRWFTEDDIMIKHINKFHNSIPREISYIWLCMHQEVNFACINYYFSRYNCSYEELISMKEFRDEIIDIELNIDLMLCYRYPVMRRILFDD
jgi:hypothetical protein